MNKAAYMTELAQRLGPLPLSQEDTADAIAYYEEYFAEAGPEREQAVIDELGSPAYVAAQIALKLTGRLDGGEGTRASGKPEKRGIRKRASLIWMIILGVLASPVALPLAFSAAAVILAMVITAAAIVFAFGISGVACMASGLIVAVYAAVSMTSDVATGLYYVGMGVFTLGLGGFLTRFGLWLGKICFKLITRICARFFRRSRKADGPAAMESRTYTEPTTYKEN